MKWCWDDIATCGSNREGVPVTHRQIWPSHEVMRLATAELAGALRRSRDLTFTRALEIARLNPKLDLRFGDWSGIVMDGEDLRGFDFTGANLLGCTFADARIEGAIFDAADIDPDALSAAIDF